MKVKSLVAVPLVISMVAMGCFGLIGDGSEGSPCMEGSGKGNSPLPGCNDGLVCDDSSVLFSVICSADMEAEIQAIIDFLAPDLGIDLAEIVAGRLDDWAQACDGDLDLPGPGGICVPEPISLMLF